ncbi:MAG: glycosyltransferase, partial [Gaiellaceae bacterium]
AAAEREDPGCLLFVGDFTHPPNVDAAVHLVRDIWPRLRQRSPQARLELIGRDPPREVRALGGDGVEVRGQVAAVEPYFARAAIVLAPVRIGGGMRVKVLEAMALAKPVITTALGIEGLAVAGTEVPVVLADGADATAEAAADLLSDADRRRSLGEQARRFVQKDFSAEAYASRLERIYAEAIDASRARRA